MTSKKPETPAEAWDAIVRTAEQAALEDEQDDHEDDEAPPTEEEADAALAAHGYDVAKINQDAAAFVQGVHDALADEETRLESAADAATTASVTEGKPALPPVEALPPSNVVPLRPKKRSVWTTLLLAAAIVGVLGASAAITVAVRDTPKNPVGPDLHLHDPPPPEMLAKAKIHEADEACDRGNMRECSALLEQAVGIDPEQQDSPAMKLVLTKRDDLVRAAMRDGGFRRDGGQNNDNHKGGR